MLISLLGQTDKRAVLYTMLKLCENLGDCCYVTNDRKAMRLMEEGPDTAGTYRNIQIHVLDTTDDDVWNDIGYEPADFDFVFLDNLYSENVDLVLYIKGAGDAEEDMVTIDALEPEDYITIKMGKPDPKPKTAKGETPHKVFNIPYDKSMPENIEYCEFYKQLKPVTSQALSVCSAILAEKCGISAKNLGKVGMRK